MAEKKTKRGRRKKIVLKFNLEDLKDMKMIDDFFNITGIAPYIKDRTISDVRQMDMHEEDGKEILKYWLANWKKVKELRGHREQSAKSRISMTWMNFSPCYNPKCKRGQIYLYPQKPKTIKEEK